MQFSCIYLRFTPFLLAATSLFLGCDQDPGGTGAPGAGAITVAVTGEEAATAGFRFNPAPAPDELVFLDGWTLRFDRWLVAVSEIRLNQPGKDPGQQQLVGDLVAQERGPWIVDLARPTDKAEVPLLTLGQAMDGGALDTRVRYAFSYDLGPATAASRPVNVAASDGALVAEMVQRGLTHYVEGDATHAVDPRPEWKDFPTQVHFKLGWGGAVSYVNCSNPDNGNDEEKNRGVQPRQDGPQRAVLTLHLEHPFWDKLNVEGPPMRFDPLAARAVAAAGAPAAVGLDDLAPSLVTGLTDRAGAIVQDRGQLPGYTPRPGSLQYDTNGTAGIVTLKQFVTYSAQSMAHLNGDGLCYVQRR